MIYNLPEIRKAGPFPNPAFSYCLSYQNQYGLGTHRKRGISRREPQRFLDTGLKLAFLIVCLVFTFPNKYLFTAPIDTPSTVTLIIL